MQVHRLCVVFFVGLILASWSMLSAAASDAVLDAKRKAAAQLLRDGKLADAVTLLSEVTAADDTSYNDHLLMARACEKLGHTAESMRHYKRVMDLLPGAPQNGDEKAARGEADKKLKLLDPQGPKIDGVVDEYLRKLDGLEREALASRNMAAIERIFRLRGLTWQAEKAKDRGFAEVFANQAWQTGGLEVKEKQSYRVRAAGVWRVKGASDALVECTAAGTDQRKEPSLTGLVGQLIAQVNGNFFALGQDVVFTAPASGPLFLMECDSGDAARTKNKGSMQVLIAPQ